MGFLMIPIIAWASLCVLYAGYAFVIMDESRKKAKAYRLREAQRERRAYQDWEEL